MMHTSMSLDLQVDGRAVAAPPLWTEGKLCADDLYPVTNCVVKAVGSQAASALFCVPLSSVMGEPYLSV